MKVGCAYWSDCGLVGGGCCACGLQGGSPTVGFCAFRCRQQAGPWRAALAATLGGMAPSTAANVALVSPLNPPVADRPTPSARQVVSFLTAFLTSPRVERRVELKRLAACAQCDHLRRASDSRLDWCGLCGCKVSLEGFRLANLAAYAENLPHWGCKHPQRGELKPDGVSCYGWPF